MGLNSYFSEGKPDLKQSLERIKVTDSRISVLVSQERSLKKQSVPMSANHTLRSQLEASFIVSDWARYFIRTSQRMLKLLLKSRGLFGALVNTAVGL